MGYLVTLNNELQWTESLEGYDGYTVISDKAARPEEDAEFDLTTHKWKIDKDKRKKRLRKGKALSLPRHELIDRLETFMDNVNQRLSIIEEKLAITAVTAPKILEDIDV